MNVTLSLLLALALLAGQAERREPLPPNRDLCAADTQALLRLDLNAFDQNAKSGWRALAAKPGCKGSAADMIALYREAHPTSRGRNQLLWHEGQLRAELGDYAEAARLLQMARDPRDDAASTGYTEGTIAFLQRDHRKFAEAYEKLRGLPEPENYAKFAAEIKRTTGFTVAWPPNLDVLDGLAACFDRSYLEAYDAPCRKRGAEARLGGGPSQGGRRL